MKVGVVAIQGDFERHIRALRNTGTGDLEITEVRTPEHLSEVGRVILPGGESTTVGLLMQRFGLGPALIEAGRSGMPIWGTCMGMILMAHGIEARPNQYTLDLLDIDVRRNAFGAQVNSFEDAVTIVGLDTPVTGVFIRAPVVIRWGTGVEVLGRYGEAVVAVKQGNLLGTSFHPEMTDDASLHQYFLELPGIKRPRAEG